MIFSSFYYKKNIQILKKNIKSLLDLCNIKVLAASILLHFSCAFRNVILNFFNILILK